MKNEWISEAIVQVYEREHPQLVERIKQIVIEGKVTRQQFEAYLKRKFKDSYKTSITVSASFVLFDRFKSLPEPPKQ